MFPLRDDNPTSATPVATVMLIIINAVIFLYQLSLGPRGEELLVYQFGSIPAVILGAKELPATVGAIPSSLTILTSMSLHGSWMHLIGNMWYLWIFGDNMEEVMGRGKFVLFYVISGFAAAMTHILSNPDSVIPTIGASGAVSGVLGAYVLIYPNARVLTLVFLGFFSRLIYIRAALVLGLWFILQLLSGSMSQGQSGAGIAFWAHVGGFVTGILLVGFFKRREVRFLNPARSGRGSFADW